MGGFARFLFSVLFAACIVLGVQARASAGEQTAPEVRQMLQEINSVRAQYGLPAVGIDGRLMRAAQAYSQQLAAEGRLSHGDFMARMAALGPGYGYVAENLAAGLPESRAVVQAWMHSPAHRANLLAPAVTVVGVARAGAVWTLILAQRGA